MRAAQLNRYIIIEISTNSKNALGTPKETYTELRRTWASVVYPSGRTQADEYGEIARDDAVFTMRYDARVNYKCRIYYGSQYYHIDHIEIIGRNEGIRLRCIKWQEDNV